MHPGDDLSARRNEPQATRFVVLLIILIATILGGALALAYPKLEPACGAWAGGGGRAAAGCGAISSIAHARSAPGSVLSAV